MVGTVLGRGVVGADFGGLCRGGESWRCWGVVLVVGGWSLDGGAILDTVDVSNRMKLGLGSREVDTTRAGAEILDNPTGASNRLEGLGIDASTVEDPGRGITFCMLGES